MNNWLPSMSRTFLLVLVRDLLTRRKELSEEKPSEQALREFSKVNERLNVLADKHEWIKKLI